MMVDMLADGHAGTVVYDDIVTQTGAGWRIVSLAE